MKDLSGVPVSVLEKHLNDKITAAVRMATGSCSVNYRLQAKRGFYLIKFIAQARVPRDRRERVWHNIRALSDFDLGPHLALQTTFTHGPWDILVLKWVNGQSVFINQLDNQHLDDLIAAYLDMTDTFQEHKSEMHVAPGDDWLHIYNTLHTDKRYHPILQDMDAKDLIYRDHLTSVIHGDFHYKNLIFQGQDLSGILDFEELKIGYPTEDLIRLILTNKEHHCFIYPGKLRFTLRLLKHLIEKTSYTRHQWMLGLNAFILTKGYKKFRSSKHFSFRHMLCLRLDAHTYRCCRKYIIKYTQPI